MALPVSIEPMTPADVDEVMAIEHLSFRLPWSKRAFLAELSLPYTVYRVARLEEGTAGEVAGGSRDWRWWRKRRDRRRSKGPIVGYAGMQIILDEGHIMTIAVHPEHRRRGLGELLLLTLFDEASARGVLRLSLEVRASNYGAQSLYRKYGFTVEGRRPRYYGDGEDALVMWSGRLDGPACRATLEDLRRRLLARLEEHHDADPGPGNIV